MNFAIVALALLGVVAADVSHLNNMYLPPVLAGLAPKQHVSYAQETQEIPQASVQEVVGNSVVEEAAAHEEAQKATGHLVVESVKFGGFGGAVQGHAAAAVVEHVKTAAAVAHQVKAHAQEVVAAAVEAEAPAAPGSDVYQSTQEQAAYYTQVSQQQEQEQEQQQQEVQEPEQKYYTGLVYHQGQEAVEQQQEVQAEVAAPQQTAFYGQQQQEFHHVEHHSGPQHSAVHVEHHVAVSAPVTQEFSQHQEQQADYFGQQSAGSSASSSSSSSSGIETQYAANGGYVY